MRHVLVVTAVLWATLLVSPVPPAAAVDSPGMAWGQWTSSDLTFGECVQRTPRALSQEGFKTIERHGRFWFGTAPESASATVVCYGLAKGTVVTITVAKVGPGSALTPVVERLAERIFTNEEPIPTPGTQANPNPAPTPKPASGGSGWGGTAGELAGGVGKRFTWDCPAGGTAVDYVVWGTDVYAIGSRVCIAAVHNGVITAARGGTVTIQILPPRDAYKGSTRNGVSTLDAGRADASFSFVSGLASKSPALEPPTGGRDWAGTPGHLRGKNGKRFTWDCPARGSARDFVVWGTDVYADGSAVCVAAVHAGVITAANGGRVTIEISPGLASYTGSTRNGVTTLSSGSAAGSFSFVR